jgi:hypothetical protein
MVSPSVVPDPGCVVKMSQIKHCPKCGRELVPNTKFCASCGTYISAIPTQIARVEPTKKKPWFAVIAVVMIIFAFLGGASIAPTRVVTTTSTYVSTLVVTKMVTTGLTGVTSGVQRLKVGQTITVLTLDKVPVEITFKRLWYADKVGYSTADKGYKFAVLDVAVKNVGTKETKTFSYFSTWTVTVDKGYTYDAKSAGYLPDSVRPEEVKTGYVYFEILQDTTAVEFRCVDKLYLQFDIVLEP